MFVYHVVHICLLLCSELLSSPLIVTPDGLDYIYIASLLTEVTFITDVSFIAVFSITSFRFNIFI